MRLNGNPGEDICEGCLSDILPFNSITNNRNFREVLMSFFGSYRHLEKASQLIFNPLDNEIRDTLVDLNRTLGGCQYYDEGQFCKLSQKFKCENKGQLSMLCLNVNGLPDKAEEIELMQETLKYKFDILGFTETHLNAVSEKFATLGDYKWAANSRTISKWGGVAIYTRPSLTFKGRTDIDLFEEGVFESVFVEIKDKGDSYIVGVIYRPPNSDTAAFLSNLSTVLEKIKDKRSYLMGDFNLDLLKGESHPATGDFLCSMNSGGLHPLIALPTRITPTSATLIDNIFTNDIFRPISSGLVYTSISDHLPAFAIFGGTEDHPEGDPQFTLKREMKIKNKERFREWL